MWEMARDFLNDQTGYVSTKLHQSLARRQVPAHQRRRMEGPVAYKTATGLMWKKPFLPKIEGVVPGPGLYKAIRN